MPRITKAEKTRIMLQKKAQEDYLKNPPYSEENKNSRYYHSEEMKGLKNIRLALEQALNAINYQTENYEYSAVLISKEARRLIGSLTNIIYEEELTRDAGQQPTEASFIALK